MAAPTIFISYRCEDTVGHAGRIFDRLVERFGKEHVFRDLDTISAGEDFVETVRQKIHTSDIVLALIGPRWLTAADEEGRWRLADENDFVRVEIVTALEQKYSGDSGTAAGGCHSQGQGSPRSIGEIGPTKRGRDQGYELRPRYCPIDR